LKELLRLENIHYHYEEDRHALEDLSLTIYEGEQVAVLGNNGAGKSTFFLCCNGILKPQSGQVFFKGERVDYRRKSLLNLRKNIGLIFQDPASQIIAGTVEAEISFGPMNLKLTQALVKERVEEALTNLSLEDFRHRPPHSLSGGEKKRVTIADVLAMEPKLLLLDEPAASLDPANTLLLEKNLDMLSQKGIGLVISTHDIDFAWRWAKRILVFSQGKLLADGKPEDVFKDENLLSISGLRQPTLYQVGKIYGYDPLPKSITDLRAKSSHDPLI
jgi:cobalt/nickel transport system ATP-binding protein